MKILSEKEGPTIIHYTMNSCVDCKWMEFQLIKSGQNPIYSYYCTHPKAIENDLDMAFIGRTDTTPHWCPVIK